MKTLIGVIGLIVAVVIPFVFVPLAIQRGWIVDNAADRLDKIERRLDTIEAKQEEKQ